MQKHVEATSNFLLETPSTAMANERCNSRILSPKQGVSPMMKLLCNHSVQFLLLILAAHVTTGNATSAKSSLAAQKEIHIRQCISYIKSAVYSEAVQEYMTLGDDTLLDRIVTQVYSNNVQNTERILMFLRNLPRDVHVGIGYEVLYNLLVINNQLDTPQLILLDYGVQQAIDKFRQFALNPEFQPKLISLKIKLNKNVGNIVRMLRNGTSDQIETFANKPTTDYDYFQYHLICRWYANNTENTEPILNFLSSRPLLSHVGLGYDQLYTEIIEREHFNGNSAFLIGFRIKEVMESANFSNADLEEKKQFDFLKSRLPHHVTNILWGQVCIKNAIYQEYLYAAGWVHAYDGKSRRVFTWREKDEKKENMPKGVWRFVTSNKGKTFRIYNTHYSEYLFASEHVYDSQRRYVFTLRKGQPDRANFEWVIQQHFHEYFVTMQNVHTNEFLYADSDDHAYNSGRRNVFARSLEKMGNQYEKGWRIELC